MNLNQLKALDALAFHGSFSQAAKALGVTQPAVSIQVRKLQDAYGVKLFRRWGRQVEFSDLGQALVLKARKVLGLLDDFEATLTAASQLESGRLDIGLSCHYFVMNMLAVFMKRYPGVQVRAQIGDSQTLIEDILACRLDLAEVTATGPDKRLFNFAYSDQSIVLFVSRHHPWAELSHLEAGQLHGEAMVARHASSMTRQIFEQRLEAFDVQPRVVMELDSWETMKEAVAAGIGFGIALEDEFTHDHRLRGIPLAQVDLTARQYFVCLPEFAHLRAVNAFLDLAGEVRQRRKGPGGNAGCTSDNAKLQAYESAWHLPEFK